MGFAKYRTLVAMVAIAIFAVATIVNPPREQNGIEICVDADVRTNMQMQVYYTASSDVGFDGFVSAEIPKGTHTVRFAVPEARIRKFRLDFGDYAGEIRLRNIVMRGDREYRPAWRDFKPNRYITKFDWTEGDVLIRFADGDPYVILAKPLAMTQSNVFKIDWHVVAYRLVLLALALCLLLLLIRIRQVTLERNDLILLTVVMLVTLVRAALSAPMVPRFVDSAWDDSWFVRAGESLLRGKWLGGYNAQTLIKGCVGPMILAFSRWIGVRFLSFSTFLHIAAVLSFSFFILRVSRNRVLAFVAYCYLVFNPLSFAFDTWQRVYRNGMVLWQLPLLVCCLCQCYRLCAERISRILPWVILSGALLWAFVNTREDGVWLLPFVIGCLLSAGIVAVRSTIGHGRLLRCFLLAMPFLIVFAGNMLVACLNGLVYGVCLRNDRDAGNYALAMRDLYLVKPDPADDARFSKKECYRHYHNIYHSTVLRAYEISPTLAAVRTEIEKAIEVFVKRDKLPDEEPWGDHILFALRNGASHAGYYRSMKESEAFWGRVHEELRQAFADGRLQRRGLALTAMTAPFQQKFIKPFFREWLAAVCMAASCRGVVVARGRLPFPEASRPLFRRMALADDDYLSRENELKFCVNRMDAVKKLYEQGCGWLFGGSVLLYALWTVYIVKHRKMEGFWLLATGIGATGLLHCACIAYVTASTFYASSPLYLCPSYLCFMLFIVVVLTGSVKTMQSFFGVDCSHEGEIK